MLRIPDIHKKFKSGKWLTEIDVRDFIQKNYKPYKGGSSFLEGPTKRTKKLFKKVQKLLKKEFKKGGVLDIDVDTPSTITSHKPGYINKKLEVILGLQTDAPLKRAIKPYGGIRLVDKSCEAYGYELNPFIKHVFGNYVRTHSDAVFNVYKTWKNFYTPENKMLRKTGVITGLPDNYGRGRIIGDYRRIALYGVDRLIDEKMKEEEKVCGYMDEKAIRTREEINDQLNALHDIKEMAATYGFDIGKPAQNTKEAVQWLYFGYLAAVKEQDGAAMSFGRIDAFLDVYAERDLKNRIFSESEIQEMIDDFVIKLRLVKHLRHPLYNELFAGDPTWVTCAVGGIGKDKRSMVTKMSYRILHTLSNLGPAPEPNMTILWSSALPEHFKCFASKISIDSSSIQFESDDLMRPLHGDDYGIACCVSAMTLGKQMQFFGARCNLPKLLLLAINEGRDELEGDLIVDGVPKLKHYKVLDHDEVKKIFYDLMKWLAKRYVETMNLIHYMHDHYNYEKSQMALHDVMIKRFMAFGIAGASIVADSLSAMKYAKVTAVRDKNGVAKDFEIRGEYPAFGNDDDRVDKIYIDAVKEFVGCLKKHKTYRNAEHTVSLLTITSNVVYGKKTGATPDGRKTHEPFAPGANPMHNRDKKGALASLNSVAKIPYKYCRDGISNTFSITPATLGKNEDARINNLKAMLDGYFENGGHHININVLNKEVLEEAMKKPYKYPNLTIRVSGYAVHFIKLTEEQQKEVISRTFHKHFY
ncbi:MAG: formate C-acetyltransferase [Patescibacteria group bacterium]|nr:formate C-acetyltransferase [Patescibacteria group bacterium]